MVFAVATRWLSPAQLARLVRATAAASDQWQPVVQFTPGRRWFHRLALTDDYETWVLTWLPGQRTGLHDHGGASGAFAVAQGDLYETLASPGSSRLRHRTAREGAVTSFGGQHVHEVGNVGQAPAVSVHAYSPPLSAMRRYEFTGSGLSLVRTDRAEVDW
jgi:predicted metal-dependent enzyme (double-stranded beta helix superfamily)